MTADSPSDFPYEEVPLENRPEVLRCYWAIAQGLQAVDGLETSSRLQELAQEHSDGVRDFAETDKLLRIYYRDLEAAFVGSNKEIEIAQSKEADYVSLRIAELLTKGAFLFSPEMLKRIHACLFQDLDPETYHPGECKQRALQKQELILNGDSVVYADPDFVDIALKVAFEDEVSYMYGSVFDEAATVNLAKFIARIWQVHPFIEGNTRTVAVFAVLYLNDLGFDVTNEPFECNSKYFRNALVRANYRNPKANTFPDRSYLERFLNQVINGGNTTLRSRDLIVEELFSNPSLLRNVSVERALEK